jgi:hypothetical protein
MQMLERQPRLPDRLGPVEVLQVQVDERLARLVELAVFSRVWMSSTIQLRLKGEG